VNKDRKTKRAAKALQRALDALMVADYCDDYHCAGDCGLPHNEDERQEMIRGTKTDHGAVQPAQGVTLYVEKPCEFRRNNLALGGYYCDRCKTGTKFDAEGNECHGYFSALE